MEIVGQPPFHEILFSAFQHCCMQEDARMKMLLNIVTLALLYSFAISKVQVGGSDTQSLQTLLKSAFGENVNLNQSVPRTMYEEKEQGK